MKKYFPFAILIMIMIACSNDEQGHVNKPYEGLRLQKAEMQVNMAVNDFSVRFGCEALMAGEGNELVAPLSMQMSLSMLANAADNNSLNEILKVLNFENMALDDVNAYNQKIWKALNDADPSATFFMANGVWSTSAIDDSYANSMRLYYDAEAETISIGTEEGRQLVNSYFDKKTNGYVPEMLTQPVTCDAMLANALVFKNKWMHKFNDTSTAKADFNNVDGTKSQVDMMSQIEMLKSVHVDGYTLVSLPFGNGAFTFDVVLPDGMDIKPSLKTLLAKGLPQIEEMKEYRTALRIPKFSIASNFKGKDILRLMGINDIFECDAAQLPMIMPLAHFIDAIDQTCALKIDEQGGEATSTTISTGQHYNINDAPERTIIVERPFIYLVRESSTGVILFMGKMTSM